MTVKQIESGKKLIKENKGSVSNATFFGTVNVTFKEFISTFKSHPFCMVRSEVMLKS